MAWPAVRTMKSRPRYRLKTASGGTRESEQLSTIAWGDWPWAVAARRFASVSFFWKVSFPARMSFSASLAVMPSAWTGAAAQRPASATPQRPARIRIDCSFRASPRLE